MPDTRSELDKSLGRLHPGESREISRTGDRYVLAERSGNGETLRFVRCTPDGFRVFIAYDFRRSITAVTP